MSYKIDFAKTKANYDAFKNATFDDSQYAVDVGSPINSPSATAALNMLDGKDKTFKQRADFVFYQLLTGHDIVCYEGSAEICAFRVNEGFDYESYDEFNRKPFLLRALVTAVFGEFLKNCVSPST